MLFELEGVTIERDSRVVLQEVTASLPPGASCVAGPSGSGKSTLLRLLNRLADPIAGVVRYEEADVRERDPLELRREVCLVPQLPALVDRGAHSGPIRLPSASQCSSTFLLGCTLGGSPGILG